MFHGLKAMASTSASLREALCVTFDTRDLPARNVFDGSSLLAYARAAFASNSASISSSVLPFVSGSRKVTVRK
jgi:hypothetical protein